MEKERKIKKQKGAIIGLAVISGVLALSTIGLGVGLGVQSAKIKDSNTKLEAVYKKNYYSLADNINSCDTNISKLLASSSDEYRAKMLEEIAQSAQEMQIFVGSLPLSSDGILQCVKFINQMSGYTQTLERKIAQGGELDESDLATLSEMHNTLNEMKEFLNGMSNRMIAGYSIMDASARTHGDFDEFSWSFTQISATEYPTMIYDGPFSDSVVDQEIKGLSGDEISREEAIDKIYELFDNVSNLKYVGQTKGKFETFNFEMTNSDDQRLYAQVTKKGGHLLTISGRNAGGQSALDYDKAEKIALNFAEKNGVNNAQVVWHQELNGQMYFNVTPTQDSVVLYPDLVKVKVDLENGNVIGFDAIAYYTNHADRQIQTAEIAAADARAQISDDFEILNERLCLSPLDFNREVLCWEFECKKDDATFYFYINAQTGKQENVLKVVYTSDGSKLM